MAQNIRWKQRLASFGQALRLLQEIKNREIESFNQLEKEGIIQRFEFTLELAWKTLKDKMEHDGLQIAPISPKTVVRMAFQNKYIEEGETWLAMIEDRNLLSHTYELAVFETVIRSIQTHYIPVLEQFFESIQTP